MGKEWTYGTCGCCEDCGQCCVSYWCFPCQDCKLNAVANGKETCGCSECCLSFLLVFFCAGFGALIYRCCTRGDVRKRVDIKGDCCSDFCCSLFCGCCSQIQEVRELVNAGLPAKLCM
eukprot:TRINITY_DN9179_c0_g1_i1.p1 TRINITY_DN9179_c0_g1~~TRINITY_DN9179_c0_g1_i1.p1  ORF type:complete len:118 (-),score=13.95 TRINITY_DN9179_c0_g1_i1:63-416(-)